MKITHVLGLTFLTAVISIGATYLYMDRDYKDVLVTVNSSLENEVERSEITDNESEEEFVSTLDRSNGWEDVIGSKWIDVWGTGEKIDYPYPASAIHEPLTESYLQEFIQEMAHQKIIADVKERSIMITPKRIENLKQVIEENKDMYEHAEQYLEVLNRWGNGDFSMVDYDHNVVMYLQHSKDMEGIAKGIASKEQEIDYIFRVFSEEVDDVFGSTGKE